MVAAAAVKYMMKLTIGGKYREEAMELTCLDVQGSCDGHGALYTHGNPIAIIHFCIFSSCTSYLRDSKSNPRSLSCVPIYLGMLCGSCVELLWEVGVDRQGWANETGMCIVSAR